MTIGGNHREIRSLTGLRGVAALLVVLVHTAATGNPKTFWEVCFWHGYLWVDLFLLLSGFILIRTYDGLFQAAPLRSAYPDFLLRRLARIWPMFVVATSFELATRQHGLTWFTSPLTHWGWPLLANLLMIQAWIGQPSIDLPAWSVSGEWACCLLFPLFRRMIGPAGAGSAFLVYLGGFAALAALAASPVPVRDGGLDLAFPDTPFPVFRCIASFAMGMALWRASGHPLLRSIATLPWLDVGLSLAILVLFGVRHTDLIIVSLFAPLILCLSRQHGPVSRALAWGPVYCAGLISYSIYLLQVPLIVLKGQGELISALQRLVAPLGLAPDKWSWLLLFYVLLLGCSAATWFFVERPSRRALRTLAKFAFRLSAQRDGRRLLEQAGR